LGNQETTATSELLAIAALIHTRQGNYDQALEQCIECVRIAEKLGETTSLAFVYNSRAVAYYRRGDHASAIQDSQRALALYRQADNIHGQAMSYNGIGNAYLDIGHWSEAFTYYQRAREIFIQTGDELHRVFANNNLGEIARHQGNLQEALAFYQEALHSLEQIGGSSYVIGVLQMNLGATFVRRNEFDTAQEYLQSSLENFNRAQAREYLPEVHRHFAEAALIAGKLSYAEAECHKALEFARELANRGEIGKTLGVLGELAGARGNFAVAEQYLGESVAILQAIGDEYGEARSQLSLAQMYLVRGNAQLALETLDRCIGVFERLQATLDLTNARQLRARVELEVLGMGNEQN
jgi:tetratricopeptide (TPR) repeat protein